MSKFTCAKCAREFPTRDQLRQHIFTVHLYPDERTRPAEVSEEIRGILASMEVAHAQE